jgi:biotin carboxylase
MTKKDLWVLFICAGHWQLDGIIEAKKLGYKIIAIDVDQNAEGFALADKYYIVDIYDTDKIINIINLQKIKLSGVICLVSDVGQKSAAIIRERFGLFGMTTDIAHKMTNKEAQRKTLKDKAGINIPKFFITENDNEKNNIDKKIGFPCVVKPVDSAGSRGVSVVYKKDRLAESIADASSYSTNGRVIIEEFIDGIEYTIETFTHRLKTTVLLITEKGKLGKTLANELFSTDLSSSEIDELNSFISRVFEVLKYNFGAGHSEVIKRKSDGKFFLVESAGRGGGFMLSDLLVPFASGFNLNKACVVQAMGFNPKEIIKLDNKVILRFIPSKKGIIKNLKGFEQGSQISNVKTGSFMKVGDISQDAAVDNNRVGFIAAKGNSISEVFLLANLVEKNILVEYYDN